MSFDLGVPCLASTPSLFLRLGSVFPFQGSPNLRNSTLGVSSYALKLSKSFMSPCSIIGASQSNKTVGLMCVFLDVKERYSITKITNLLVKTKLVTNFFFQTFEGVEALLDTNEVDSFGDYGMSVVFFGEDFGFTEGYACILEYFFQ